MNKTLRPQLFSTALVAMLFTACGLDEQDKQACINQTDCLGGFTCTGGLCLEDAKRCTRNADCLNDETCISGSCVDDRPTNSLGPPVANFEYGTYQAFGVETEGLVAGSGESLVTIASLDGTLGCALTSSAQAAPGIEASAIVTKLDFEGGDARCPAGVYPVINNPGLCGDLDHLGEPRPGCVLYKRWNSSGELAANRLAIGGAITVETAELVGGMTSCNIIMTFNFGEDTPTHSAFFYEYDPLAPKESFCVQAR